MSVPAPFTSLAKPAVRRASIHLTHRQAGRQADSHLQTDREATHTPQHNPAATAVRHTTCTAPPIIHPSTHPILPSIYPSIHRLIDSPSSVCPSVSESVAEVPVDLPLQVSLLVTVAAAAAVPSVVVPVPLVVSVIVTVAHVPRLALPVAVAVVIVALLVTVLLAHVIISVVVVSRVSVALSRAAAVTVAAATTATTTPATEPARIPAAATTATAPAAAALTPHFVLAAILLNLDLALVQLLSVELLDGGLHVAEGEVLDHSDFSPVTGEDVGVVDVSHVASEILEVLPRHTLVQSLDNHSPVGASVVSRGRRHL
mmetsp:Transcript_4948/g.11566  ORF Transcript_4948/g.11566 Transcript_4948/m.11566 type:complete len:315 (-) Transcript_4948:364-1308(-)